MKNPVLLLTLAICASCSPLMAQATYSAANLPLPKTTVNPSAEAVMVYHARVAPAELKPFSVIAVSGGVSSMGINMQAAVNMNRYMNLRSTGNYLNYTLNNISTNGFNVTGQFNFATAATTLDFFPFPNHGFRISPGVMFRNNNSLGATIVAQGGTSFTLDSNTFYSAAAAPVTGTASLGLGTTKPVFMATTGWGNMIPRRGGGHFSFPVEIGAAFTGAPVVGMALTSGEVCTDPQGTQNCTPVVGNSMVNTSLQAQITKYQNDVNPYKYYPILSFGMSYNFHIRH